MVRKWLSHMRQPPVLGGLTTVLAPRLACWAGLVLGGYFHRLLVRSDLATGPADPR